MKTVKQLITELYSKSWVKRMLSKAQSIGLNLEQSVSDKVLLFMGNFFTKVNTIIKQRNNEKLQSASKPISRRESIQQRSESTNVVADTQDRGQPIERSITIVETSGNGMGNRSTVSEQHSDIVTTSTKQDTDARTKLINAVRENSRSIQRATKEQSRIARKNGRIARENGRIARENGQIARENGQIALATIELAKCVQRERIRSNDGRTDYTSPRIIEQQTITIKAQNL